VIPNRNILKCTESALAAGAARERYWRSVEMNARPYYIRIAPSIAAVLTLASCGPGGSTPPARQAFQAQHSSIVRNHARSERCRSVTCIYVAVAGPNGAPPFPEVLIIAGGADGDVRPVQTFQGDLGQPEGIAVDTARNIYVASGSADIPIRDWVTVYAAGSHGYVTPIQTINGAKTGICHADGVAVDANRDIYVVNTNYPGSKPHCGRGSNLLVFAAGASGNVAPIRKIQGSKTHIGLPTGIAVDVAGNAYVMNSAGVVVYAPGANGNVKPIQTVSGSNTGLTAPKGIAVDAASNIYITNSAASYGSSINVFAAGSDGNVAPIKIIQGKRTRLDSAFGCAVDADGQMYTLSEKQSQHYSRIWRVLVFAAEANGNVAPLQTVTGKKTQLSWSRVLAVR
jgi:hypothetical protein